MSLRRRTRSRLAAALDPTAGKALLWRQLAASAATGAETLLTLGRRTRDLELRGQLEQLAGITERHAAALSAHSTASAPDSRPHALPFDLSEGRAGDTLGQHGLPIVGVLQELETIPCLVDLLLATQRTQQIYAECRRLAKHRDTAAAVLCQTIHDDLAGQRHALEQALERQRATDPDRVDQALREARRSPFMAAWKRTGLRSGASLSRGMLYLFYWTLLLPFGLLSRRSQDPPRRRATPADTADLRSQY